MHNASSVSGELTHSSTQALAAKRLADGTRPDKYAARALDVEVSTYQRWRTGKSVPGDEHAPTLAEYLGLEVSEIYVMLGEARRARLAITPPPNLEDRVTTLEANYANGA